MRCSKCGVSNADGAKFCSRCGNKLPQQDPIRLEPMKFHLGGYDELKIILSPAAMLFGQAIEPVMNDAWAAYNKMRGEFVNVHSMEDAFKYAIPAFAEAFRKLNEDMYLFFLATKTNNFTEQDLFDTFVNECDLENKIGDIYNAYLKLSDYADKMKAARNIQRSSRMYWQGGGFGIKGAIKGAIKAGIMNAGTRAVYGICDGITDARDRKKYYELDAQYYDAVLPCRKLRLAFADCCQCAVRLLAELFFPAYPPAGSIRIYDREEIARLDRVYKSAIERMERLGRTNEYLEDMIISVFKRINEFPFDIYPYWDLMLNVGSLLDFSEYEQIFSVLHVETPHRIIFETRQNISRYNFRHDNEDKKGIEMSIEFAEWLKTSKYADPHLDDDIAYLKQKLC